VYWLCYVLYSLPWYTRKAVQMEFDYKNRAFTVKNLDYHPLTRWRDLVMVSAPVSLRGSIYYWWLISMNIQINNVIRAVELLYYMIISADYTKPDIDLHKVYLSVMNSSLLQWIRADDNNACFEDMVIPCGRRGFGGGKEAVRFKEIVIALDHENEVVTHLVVNGDFITDPMEITATVFIIGAIKHGFTHLVAAEVAYSKWKLAERAGWCINGLNYSIVNEPSNRFFIADGLVGKTLRDNMVSGVPHHHKTPSCMSKSGVYRTMARLHHHPLLATVGNAVAQAAVINNCILHSIDHFVLDQYLPLWIESPKLFNANYTMLKNFLGGNNDFTHQFSVPKDELSQLMLDILKEEAPELAPGYRWAAVS